MPESNKSSGNERVTQQRRPSVRDRFSQPTVMKQGSIFLLCTDDGDIRARSDQGLYFRDMRYLSAQTLRLNGKPLISLLADAGQGCTGRFELTNPDLQDGAGNVAVTKETLGIHRE